MKKGNIVQLSGSVSAWAWKDMNGEPKASLNFHVNTIKLHGGGKSSRDEAGADSKDQPAEDLPF